MYACACTCACLCITAKRHKSHLEIMKRMLAVTLTRKRTTPIKARETARDTNNNSYDRKLEHGNNCHILIHHRCSLLITKISRTYAEDVILDNENKTRIIRIIYLFLFQLVRGDWWFILGRPSLESVSPRQMFSISLPGIFYFP